MDWQYVVNGLVFNDDFVLYKHIQTITNLQMLSLVGDRLGHFGFNPQTSLAKLVSQALLVSGLEQAGAKRGMHLDG